MKIGFAGEKMLIIKYINTMVRVKRIYVWFELKNYLYIFCNNVTPSVGAVRNHFIQVRTNKRSYSQDKNELLIISL